MTMFALLAWLDRFPRLTQALAILGAVVALLWILALVAGVIVGLLTYWRERHARRRTRLTWYVRIVDKLTTVENELEEVLLGLGIARPSHS